MRRGFDDQHKATQKHPSGSFDIRSNQPSLSSCVSSCVVISWSRTLYEERRTWSVNQPACKDLSLNSSRAGHTKEGPDNDSGKCQQAYRSSTEGFPDPNPPMIGNNNNPRLSSAAQSNTLTNSIAKIRMA